MTLTPRRVAILVEQDYEDSELNGPLRLLREAGVEVTVVGPFAKREYEGKRGGRITSDAGASGVRAADFDAVIIPGGHAPDRMRMRHAMVDFVRDATDGGKLVAAICHGPQLLISADAVRGRTLTCWPSIAIDVRNAGGLYVDRPVVRDGTLITSRKPDDVPQFVAAILEALGA
jgi:protease I